MPEGLNWKHVYGLSWLAGIGFTMALFVNELAFSGRASGAPPAMEHLDQARIGIFLASITAGTVGVFYLRRVSRGEPEIRQTTARAVFVPGATIGPAPVRA